MPFDVHRLVVNRLEEQRLLPIKFLVVEDQSIQQSERSQQGCEAFKAAVFVGDGDEGLVVDYEEDAAVEGVCHHKIGACE